jgi:anti-sigma B factor antagonist
VGPMRVRSEERRGWTVVTVRGVVDVASAPELRQVLQEAQYAGSTRVLVDLDEVELLDSFGIGVLVGAHKRARTHDGELAILVTRERLRQLFVVTGLDATLHLVADPDEVLDAYPPRDPEGGRS